MLLLGLNSSKYNLNFIQEDFLQTLAGLGDNGLPRKKKIIYVIDKRKSLSNTAFELQCFI